jgi:hypothetical protein
VRKAVTRDDFRSSGRAIEVLEGGPISEQRMHILADDEFVVEIREPRDLGAGLCRFDLSRQERTRLDPAVAAAAWRRIGSLGIFSWRGSLPPGDVAADVADEPRWSVTVGGRSALAEPPGPGSSTASAHIGANSYEALREILEPLDRETSRDRTPAASAQGKGPAPARPETPPS